MARATIRTTQQANEQLRKSNPELFVSRLLLARKIESDLREQGSFDRKKIPRIARDNSRTQFKELQARRKDSVKRLLQPFNREETERIKKERRIKTRAEAQERARSADRRRDPRVATPQAEIDRQKVTRPTTTRTRRRITREGELTREQRDNLSRQEAQAGIDIQNDPDLQGIASPVLSFIERLRRTDPAKREKLLEEFRQTSFAKAEGPIKEEEDIFQRDLVNKLRQANEAFNILSDEQLFNFESKLKSLDRDTVRLLSENLDNLQSRGILNSGALKQFADKVIETRAINIEAETKGGEFATRRIELARDVDVESLDISRERSGLGFRRRREQDRFLQFARDVENVALRDFLLQKAGGSFEPDFGGPPPPGEPPPPAAAPPAAVSPTDFSRVDPSATSPLEFGRRIQERRINIPTPPSRSRSFRTLPEIRDTGRTISASSRPGTTLQERSRLRGLARGSRSQ